MDYTLYLIHYYSVFAKEITAAVTSVAIYATYCIGVLKAFNYD